MSTRLILAAILGLLVAAGVFGLGTRLFRQAPLYLRWIYAVLLFLAIIAVTYYALTHLDTPGRVRILGGIDT